MKRKWTSESAMTKHLGAAVTSSSNVYDVFLNFRGADTRYNFVDCLYEFLTVAGIRVFMDDEALRIGDDIGDEVLKAMDVSRLYMPIFSRNYASSKWCLIELARMVEVRTRGSGSKDILPVFFDVEPEDVKLKTELYKEDLLLHEESFGSCTVRKWRKALREVSEMKGWNLQSHQGQGKLIREIAGHISHRLERKHRILPDHFVGIEEQVLDILDKLDLRCRDVRIMVIHGMGGIGKTTLASAIFNKICGHFQGCSFLSNVRESAAYSGIINLQNKLLQDMLRFSSYHFYDANDAMNCIQASLRNRNVLVVLDDVSKMDQIRKLIGMGSWVGPGSRVIVTTRNLNCIPNVEEIENNVAVLQGKKIYIHQMRELSFDKSLQLLCQHAFSRCVLSNDYEHLLSDILSFTRGVPLALEVVGSYLRGKGVTIWKEMLKKFKKMPHDKTTAFYYWEACDLGREAVRKQSNRVLGRQSRLCNEEAKHLLLKREGTEYVKALKLDSTNAHNFIPAELSGLSGLRFLELCGGNFVGKFDDDSLSGLGWLSWQDCPHDFRGSNFCFKNLVVLRLSRSIVTDTWTGWEQFKTARNLRVLELEDVKLTATPDLSSFFSLEKLVVHQFGSIVRVDPLIGNLECLNSMEMIDHRWSPDDITLSKSSLEVLHLPSSICNLKALSRLVIMGFKMKQLPESIGDLRGLKSLEITWCELMRKLPDSIGDLNSLCKLRLEGDGITDLPESIGKLGNLTELDVSYNRLRLLPETIGALDRLQVLDACGNGDLEGPIPGEFGGLQSLKSLDLSWTWICGLPSSMFRLSRLESLVLGDCHEIQELFDLPTSLTNLQISSWSLKAVPDLSGQTNLVNLKLSNRGYRNYDDNGHPLDNPQVLAGNITAWIHHLQKLQSLTVDLSPMLHYLSTGLDPFFSRLKHLQLSCPDPSLARLPSGLEYLSLDHSTSLSSCWDRHSNLEGLSTLSLYASEIRLDGLESLTNLIRLEIRGCDFLERMQDISRLQKLQVLHISECSKLLEIGGLTHPTESLRRLEIWRCHSILCLPDRSGTVSASDLHLEVIDCRRLQDFNGPYDGYIHGGNHQEQFDHKERSIA